MAPGLLQSLASSMFASAKANRDSPAVAKAYADCAARVLRCHVESSQAKEVKP